MLPGRPHPPSPQDRARKTKMNVIVAVYTTRFVRFSDTPSRLPRFNRTPVYPSTAPRVPLKILTVIRQAYIYMARRLITENKLCAIAIYSSA